MECHDRYSGTGVDAERRHAGVREVHARLQEWRLQRRHFAGADGYTEPEFINAYELGLKQTLSERLTANVSLFYYDYQDASIRSTVRDPVRTSTRRASSIWRKRPPWASSSKLSGP